jgi:hypothetical protein
MAIAVVSEESLTVDGSQESAAAADLEECLVDPVEDGLRLLDSLFKVAIEVLHEAHMAGKVIKRGRLRKYASSRCSAGVAYSRADYDRSLINAAQQLYLGVRRRPDDSEIDVSCW